MRTIRRFEGKTVLITGGGSGMGRSSSKMFAMEGAQVAIADIDIEKANKIVTEIKGNKGEAFAIKCNVSDPPSVKVTVRKAIEQYGKIDILVNGVGIAGKVAPIQELSDKDWDTVLNVNLKGAFLFAKEVIPFMLNAGKGKIVNISSVAGKDGNANMVPYCASKAGIIGLTKALATELAPYKINVNCVVPGITNTPFLSSLTKEEIDRLKQKVPLKRLAEPEEIANVILFLASEETDFVTGQTYNITGGRAKY